MLILPCSSKCPTPTAAWPGLNHPPAPQARASQKTHPSHVQLHTGHTCLYQRSLQQRKSFARAKPRPLEQAPTSENSVNPGKTKEACGTYVGTKGCWMRNIKKGGGGKRRLIQGSVQKLALLGSASPTGSQSPVVEYIL